MQTESAHSLSCNDRKVIVFIFYIDYDGAGAGVLMWFPTIFGLHQNGVFLCFLEGWNGGIFKKIQYKPDKQNAVKDKQH